MKKLSIIILAFLTACTSVETKKVSTSNAVFINETLIAAATDSIKALQPGADMSLLEKGVKHAASLWRDEDGTPSDFTEFVKTNYISDPAKRKIIFNKISTYIESIYGNFNEVSLDLKKTLDEAAGDIDEIDRMFGNYSVGAHLQDDFYANKIAFVVALNFPYFTLAEKEKLGPSWSRDEWAMARLGDMFVARVPADLQQKLDAALGDGEMYIAEYNICMGHLRTDDGRQLFPEDMVLLSHWNLRDELKADYADRQNGPEKQEMIVKVMEHIIYQDIPKVVINNPEYDWAPFSNKVTKAGASLEAAAEPDTRYQLILNIFHAHQAVDKYFPEMNTAILRRFSWEMEIAQPEVEQLFDTYMKSPQLKSIASIISKRLGRELKPFDVWYNGFKTGSTIPEEQLTSKTSSLYPDPASFEAGMPAILIKMGWSPERAKYLAGKIVVDPARGSGHAAGSAMKGAVSHLRTRISDKGMDYKGYNIAVHEFGHNVEQTISMYDVDNYMMSGVPNTACTEAMAYVFQSRDLRLLGMKDENPEKTKMETLDAAWDLMEIMGVGMIEMRVWKWLYENPQSTAAQLKEKMIGTAIEVWNEYFAPVIGVKDSPLLAIYSHMVNTPLYLPNYSYGRIIHFQVEEYLQGKNLSSELDRILKQGRLTPQQWMMGAVGSKISTQPLLNAVDEAIKK
jgi:hypothetical protein